MRLVATETSRVVHLVVADEVRPIAGIDLPLVCHEVASRYGFGKVPTSLDTFASPSGLKFEYGRFAKDQTSASIPIVELSIFNDGVVAACGTTDIGDMLVDDLLGWALESNFIRPPITAKPRLYLSNLIVHFDKLSHNTTSRAFPSTAKCSSMLSKRYGRDIGTVLTRLELGGEPPRQPATKPINFVLERRAGTETSDNLFWSSAPIRINDHLELLEAIEIDLTVL